MAAQLNFRCPVDGVHWTTEIYPGSPVPLVGDRVTKDTGQYTVVRREWAYTGLGTLRSINVMLMPVLKEYKTTTRKRRTANSDTGRGDGDAGVHTEAA